MVLAGASSAAIGSGSSWVEAGGDGSADFGSHIAARLEDTNRILR